MKKNNVKKELANYVASVETINTTNIKEDNAMDNTTNNNVMVTFEGKQITEKKDLMDLTIAQLNELSRSFGLNGYPKKARKLEIVSMLWDDLCDLADEKHEFEKTCAEVVEQVYTMSPLDDPMFAGMDVSDDVLLMPTPVEEEKEEETMVEAKTVTVNEDEKKANGNKLVKMLISVWIYNQRSEYYYTDSTGQTHESKYHLFFWSKKYNAMIASRKALMKVTNDTIVATFGEQYAYSETNNNYWLILKAYETVADRGFCTVNNSDVFISAEQWDKMNRQVDLLQRNAIEAGCKTMKEYICQ